MQVNRLLKVSQQRVSSAKNEQSAISYSSSCYYKPENVCFSLWTFWRVKMVVVYTFNGGTEISHISFVFRSLRGLKQHVMSVSN